MFFESRGNIIEHVLHIFDSSFLVSPAKYDFIAFVEVIIYRKNTMFGIYTNQVAHGVIAFVTAGYAQTNKSMKVARLY